MNEETKSKIVHLEHDERKGILPTVKEYFCSGENKILMILRKLGLYGLAFNPISLNLIYLVATNRTFNTLFTFDKLKKRLSLFIRHYYNDSIVLMTFRRDVNSI